MRNAITPRPDSADKPDAVIGMPSEPVSSDCRLAFGHGNTLNPVECTDEANLHDALLG